VFAFETEGARTFGPPRTHSKRLTAIKHLIELNGQCIGFHRVTEFIDTTTSVGTLMFHICGALAEVQRNLIRERTYAGPAVARAGKRATEKARRKAAIGCRRSLPAEKTHNK
jgi:DNA invertase Pin-like site-specific DNA recombinase